MKMPSKITLATLSKAADLGKARTEPVYVGRIYGSVSHAVMVPTQYGEATCLKGEFVGVDSNGVEFMANKCYLPDLATDALTAALTGDVNRLEFGFDFSAVPSEKSKTGYVWEVSALMDVKPSAGLLSFAEKLPKSPNLEPEVKKEERKAKK